MQYIILVFSLVITIAGSGCQKVSQPANLPPLFPLTVTVLQEGAPVEGAFVRILPEKEGVPWSCGATTDANGNAAIKTVVEFRGAPAGKYKVLISKMEIPKQTATDLSNLDTPITSEASENVNLVDVKYSMPQTTTLVVNVEKGQPNVTFDVGAPVRTVLKGPQ